jgi:hypothetical protein
MPLFLLDTRPLKGTLKAFELEDSEPIRVYSLRANLSRQIELARYAGRKGIVPSQTRRHEFEKIMINPGKAGPKGALDPAVQKSIPGASKEKPTSGPPGAEGNNTRRDFVQLPKKRKR